MNNETPEEVWLPAPDRPPATKPAPDRRRLYISLVWITLGVAGILLTTWCGWQEAEDEASRLMYLNNPLSFGGKLFYTFYWGILIPPFNLGALVAHSLW